MDLGLTEKRVLVCGASRGLGAAIAAAFEDERASVVRAARRRGTDGEEWVEVDLAEETGPRAAVDAAVSELGGLDVLVVNGGGPPGGSFEDLDDGAWHRAIDLTLFSAIRLVRAALPALRVGRDPAVLLVLSSSVREPIDRLDTSNVLRPGLAGLVKSLATQLPPVRVNAVLPGRFATDRVAELDADRAASRGTTAAQVVADTSARIPLGRYGDPAELGRTAVFLCSPAASYLTGVNLPVDGGLIRSLP